MLDPAAFLSMVYQGASLGDVELEEIVKEMVFLPSVDIDADIQLR